MNFFDLCYDLFMRTSKYYDLGKDVQNYNKAICYLSKFYSTARGDIEQFIVEVREDNPIIAAKQLLLKSVISGGSLKLLSQLYPNELFNELCGELYNIVLKGAYDSIQIMNQLDEDEKMELARRLVVGDETVFIQYKSV